MIGLHIENLHNDIFESGFVINLIYLYTLHKMLVNYHNFFVSCSRIFNFELNSMSFF